MSAINPASFASPSLGIQAPSGVGPGAVGANRNTLSDRRPQPEGSAYSTSASGGVMYQNAFTSHASDRITQQGGVFPPTGYTYGYTGFPAPPRSSGTSMSGFNPGVAQQLDSLSGFATPIPDYPQLPPQQSAYSREGGGFGQPPNVLPTNNDAWLSSFQQLSMGSQ